MLRGKVDPKKEEQERLQGLLLDMLKEEENKYCADCQAKTPRWAAWNLGVFICIRCAGIHRNLGVHISKVRSVNLDSWTPEQVQTMRVMGNEKARQVYERELPPQFRRPTSDSQMEQFIRNKYEHKRYCQQGFVYPTVDVADLPKPMLLGANKKAASANPVVSISGSKSPSSNGRSNSNTGVGGATLIDFSAPAQASSANAVTSSNILDDLASLNIQSSAPAAASASNNDFDDFGSFVSATTTSTAPAATDSFAGFADFASSDLTAPASTQPAFENGIETKKSNADIMSLFGTSNGGSGLGGVNGGSAPVLVAPGGFAGFGLQAAPQVAPVQSQAFPAFGQQMQPPQQKDLFGGLSGINFSVPPQQQQSSSLNFGATFGSVASASNQFSMQPQVGGFGGTTTSAPKGVTSPTSPTGFSIPNKSNAFADLALGKVMKTSYGQSALNPSSSTTTGKVSPSLASMSSTSSFSAAPTLMPSTTSSVAASNDLFDMFSSAPPPVPITVSASSGLDDLLGL